MPDQLSRFPIHPHETKVSVLLARARDILRDVAEDPVDSTEVRDLLRDIDDHLTQVALGTVDA